MSKHIVALPFPGEGHVSPMMHLSIFLAKHGFSITFAAVSMGPFDAWSLIQAKNTWPPPGMISRITVEHLTSSVEFPAEIIAENRADMTQLLLHARSFSASLEELVRRIPDKVHCIISDYLYDWCPSLAARLGALGVVLVPASATVTWCELSIGRLAAAGLVPSQPGGEIADEEDEVVVTSPGIRRSEIPWHFCGDRMYQDYIERYNSETIRLADWTIANTCVELESEVVSVVSRELMDAKFLPVGPLFLLNDEPSTAGLLVCDHRCLDWLDRQPPSSVLYVSFGSFAVMTGDQMEEIVRGVEASGKRFLWVIRPDPGSEELISKVESAARDGRGLIVPWTPQVSVLSHPSTGAFLSHCGWNSTLEAAAIGKPVLCWPLLFEQNTNAISLARKWNIGLEFARRASDGMVGREEVERIIRLAMDGEEGRRIRESASALGEKIRANNVPSSGLERFVAELRKNPKI